MKQAVLSGVNADDFGRQTFRLQQVFLVFGPELDVVSGIEFQIVDVNDCISTALRWEKIGFRTH